MSLKETPMSVNLLKALSIFFLVVSILPQSIDAIPKSMAFSATVKKPGENLTGRFPVSLSIIDENGVVMWSDSFEDVFFINGNFKVDLGKNKPLPLTVFNNDKNLKVNVKVAGTEESVSIVSVPFSMVSHFSSEAGTVDWANIKNKPQLDGQLAEVQIPNNFITDRMISKISASKIEGVLPRSSSFSDSVGDGYVTFNIQNMSVNNETGSKLTMLADKDRISGSIKVFKDTKGNQSMTIGTDSNADLIFMRNGEEKLRLTASGLVGSAAIDLSAPVIRNVPSGFHQLYLKNDSVNNDTGSKLLLESDNGAISFGLNTFKTRDGVKQAMLFANTDLIILRNGEEKIRISQAETGINAVSTNRLTSNTASINYGTISNGSINDLTATIATINTLTTTVVSTNTFITIIASANKTMSNTASINYGTITNGTITNLTANVASMNTLKANAITATEAKINTLQLDRIIVNGDPKPVDTVQKYDPVNNSAIRPCIAVFKDVDLRYSSGTRRDFTLVNFQDVLQMKDLGINSSYQLISFDVTIIDKYGKLYKPELITEGQQWHPYQNVEVSRVTYWGFEYYNLLIYVGYMGQPVSNQERFSLCKIIVKFDMGKIN